MPLSQNTRLDELEGKVKKLERRLERQEVTFAKVVQKIDETLGDK